MNNNNTLALTNKSISDISITDLPRELIQKIFKQARLSEYNDMVFSINSKHIDALSRLFSSNVERSCKCCGTYRKERSYLYCYDCSQQPRFIRDDRVERRKDKKKKELDEDHEIATENINKNWWCKKIIPALSIHKRSSGSPSLIRLIQDHSIQTWMEDDTRIDYNYLCPYNHYWTDTNTHKNTH